MVRPSGIGKAFGLADAARRYEVLNHNRCQFMIVS